MTIHSLVPRLSAWAENRACLLVFFSIVDCQHVYGSSSVADEWVADECRQGPIGTRLPCREPGNSDMLHGHDKVVFFNVTGKKINGEAFSYCSEEEWKSYGISPGSILILRKRIMNEVFTKSIYKFELTPCQVEMTPQFTMRSCHQLAAFRDRVSESCQLVCRN